MSTKTSIKRIALVAVSALGFGLLSVVPAKAEIINNDISYGKTDTVPTTANSISAPTAVGTQMTSTLEIITADGAGGGDGVPSVAVVNSVTYTLLDPNGTDVTASATFAAADTLSTGISAVTVSGATINFTLAANAAVGTRTFGKITFTPTKVDVILYVSLVQQPLVL